MKIERDGITIELTEDEIDQAYRERKRYFNKCDLIHKIKSYCDERDWEEEIFRPDSDEIEIGNVTITAGELQKRINDPDWMENLELNFQNALESNDSYWESFWTTAEYVIEDTIQKQLPNTDTTLDSNNGM